jgi:hypothetical protein
MTLAFGAGAGPRVGYELGAALSGSITPSDTTAPTPGLDIPFSVNASVCYFLCFEKTKVEGSFLDNSLKINDYDSLAGYGSGGTNEIPTKIKGGYQLGASVGLTVTPTYTTDIIKKTVETAKNLGSQSVDSFKQIFTPWKP